MEAPRGLIAYQNGDAEVRLEVRPMSRAWFVTFVAVLPLTAMGCAGNATDGPAGADDGGADSASLEEASAGGDASPVEASSGHDAGAGTDAATGADASNHDAGPGDAGSDGPTSACPTTMPLDMHSVTLFDNPANLADWPVTTQLTDVEFQYQGSDGIYVEFSKKTGTGSWPDVTPPGWTGTLEYTLGMVECINGQWYGSAAMQYWRDVTGPTLQGGNVAQDTVTLGQCTAFGLGSSCQVAKNWYYDGRWGNLAGYQPATGEVIGIFVAAGNLRGVTDGSQSPVQERSDIVLLQMPTVAGGKFTF